MLDLTTYLKMMTFEVCPNCSQKVTFSKEGLRFICNLCGGWTINKGEKIENLQENYSEDYFNGREYISYAKSESARKLNFKRKIKILDNVILKGIFPEILELGSAFGDFVSFMKEKSSREVVGIEISDYARYCAKLKGIQLFHPDEIESINKNFKPKLLVGWDVWEHFENPAETFRKILTRFSTIEMIAITTLDSGSIVASNRKEKWRQFHPPTHLNYPTKKSISIFARRQGFKIIYCKNFGYYRPLFEYLNVLKIRTQWPKFPVYLNLNDIQFVILKKNFSKNLDPIR